MSLNTPAVMSPLTGTATNGDERAALERRKVPELAREFEAMLMLQMVRQMRQSFLAGKNEEEGDGFGKEVLTDTLDVELARQLAASGGIGLARSIEAAMNRLVAAPARTAAPEGDVRTVPTRDVDPVTVSSPVAPPRGDDGAPTPAARIEAQGAVGAMPGPGGAGDADAAEVSSLTMPLDTPLSSAFGWRADPFHGHARFHAGVDFRAAYGKTVPVAAPGVVTFAGEQRGYGLTVVVQHPGNVQTRYAHLSSIDVASGEELAPGRTVGRVGQTGRATGPHLHFEVLLDGERVDPALVARRVPERFKSQGQVADSSGDPVFVDAPSNGVDHED